MWHSKKERNQRNTSQNFTRCHSSVSQNSTHEETSFHSSTTYNTSTTKNLKRKVAINNTTCKLAKVQKTLLYGRANTCTAEFKNNNDQQQKGTEISRKYMIMYLHHWRSLRLKHKKTDPSHKLEDMQAETSMQDENSQNDKFNYFNMTQQSSTSKQTINDNCGSNIGEYINMNENRKLSRNQYMNIYMREYRKNISEHRRQDTDYKEKQEVIRQTNRMLPKNERNWSWIQKKRSWTQETKEKMLITKGKKLRWWNERDKILITKEKKLKQWNKVDKMLLIKRKKGKPRNKRDKILNTIGNNWSHETKDMRCIIQKEGTWSL